jgi:AcrR family transcriptional regulator
MASRLSASERRARLVVAATKVFARKGFRHAQIADVVREAKVARGTFYRHFESKRAVVAAVAREWLDGMAAAASAVPDVGSREAFDAATRALVVDTLRAYEEKRPTARILHDDGAAHEPAVSKAIASHEEAWRRRYAALLARARAAGVLSADLDVDLASSCALGAVQRVVRADVLRGRSPDVTALADRVARLLSRGSAG